MFAPVTIPKIIEKLFPEIVFSKPALEKTIYLTFDDGPIPIVTEWVLELLKKENIKATFFCIGNNIEKHPEIFKKVIAHKHSVGNHTFNHLNGWKFSRDKYLKNITLCDTEISKHINLTHKIFRPPYGKINFFALKKIKSLGYSTVMWNVLSYDFDKKKSSEVCLKNVLQNVRNGSIIVFHDSEKAFNNLKNILPQVIKELKKQGFCFGVLN